MCDADLAPLISPRPSIAGLPGDRTAIMGIVNVTPDSFSDGGRHATARVAVAAARAMIAAGADIVDIGAESTRPGAMPVELAQELARLAAVMPGLAGINWSIDTRKVAVMTAAIDAGAALVNDVSALTHDDVALGVVAAARCPVVLMHHRGDPQTMQDDPRYDDVLLDVFDWLKARIETCVAAGIARDHIIVDPGIGFGKTLRHNIELLNGLSVLHGLGCPLLVGASRKRFIGALSNEAPADRRLGGSVAVAVVALGQGVQLLRVHDVPETVQAMQVWRGLRDIALTPPR